jgi:Uma2 family endonuclease
MGMPEMARSWTREMVLALPDDGNRYELFGGELLVTPAPAPRHQFVVATLLRILGDFVTAQAVGRVLASPADVALDGEQLAQPDLFMIPGAPGPAPRAWAQLPLPILVVEVLSPSTARYDRQVKRRWFQRAGIAEYWIVDLDSRLVERWRPSDTRPEITVESLEWRPEGAGTPLRIDLPPLFDQVLGPA